MNTLHKHIIELDLTKIPPAPQVLISLIDLFNQTDISFQQLESIIEKDTALFARVISIANSAAYSQWNNATELKQILVVLGTKTLKTITMTSAVHQFFSQFNDELGVLMGRLWLDALICAHLCRQLANLTAFDKPDEAYLGGLLHQLGQLIFIANNPQQYQSMLQQASNQNALLFDEQKHFGIQSSDLAADVIDSWQIESCIQDAIRYQHKPAELLQDAQSLVKIVSLSSKLCNRLNHTNNKYLVEDNLFGLNQPVIEDLLVQSTQLAIADAAGFGIKVDTKSALPEINIDDESVRLELARKVRQIALLDGIHQQIEAFENTADMMKLVSENLQMLFGLSTNMFFFPDQQQTVLTGIASHSKNIRPDQSFSIEFKSGRSLVTQAALENCILDSLEQTFFTEIPVIDQQIKASMKSTQLLCLPLFSQHQLLAVIAIGCEQHQLNRLSADHQLLLHFSTVIANSMAQQQRATIELQQQQQLKQQEIQLHTRKVIHEVNNPLTIINNYLEIIAMDLEEDSENRQHLDTVRSEIDRVGELLLQLKSDQEAIMESRGDDSPEVDINSLINNLVTLYKPTFYKINHIQSELVLDPKLPLIACNQNKLKQILSNLLKNAAESLPDKGIIKIQSKALIIVNSKKFIQITISDNGSGIPESILESLFSPVQTTKGANHSGLGLTIVNKLVSDLKGSISYSTSDFGGAEFTILLPRK